MNINFKILSLGLLFSSTILNQSYAMQGGDEVEQKSQITGVRAAAQLFSQGSSPVRKQSAKASQVEGDTFQASSGVKKLASKLKGETEKKAEEMLQSIRKKAQELIAQKIEEVNTRKSEVFKEVTQKLTERNLALQTIFQENSQKSSEYEQSLVNLKREKDRLASALNDQLFTKSMLRVPYFQKETSVDVNPVVEEIKEFIFVPRIQLEAFDIENYVTQLRQMLELIQVDQAVSLGTSGSVNGSVAQLHGEIEEKAEALLQDQKEILLREEKEKASAELMSAFTNAEGDMHTLYELGNNLAENISTFDRSIQGHEFTISKLESEIATIQSQILEAQSNTLVTKSGLLKVATLGYYGGNSQPAANPEVVPAMPEATPQAAPKASGWMGSWFQKKN